MGFGVGATVTDLVRSTRGRVWKRNGALLFLEDAAGRTWTVLEGRCVLAADSGAETVGHPPNAVPVTCTPDQMAVNDLVRLGTDYHRVLDMRSKGGASGRILILEGYGPWVMTAARQVYRPIKTPGPGDTRPERQGARQSTERPAL